MLPPFPSIFAPSSIVTVFAEMLTVPIIVTTTSERIVKVLGDRTVVSLATLPISQLAASVTSVPSTIEHTAPNAEGRKITPVRISTTPVDTLVISVRMMNKVRARTRRA